MSLYSLLHGRDPNAGAILSALEIDPAKIDRFRDASFGKDGDQYVLRIFCRAGGGNRESCPNVVLTSHPLYLRDHDDAYDCTYAHFYFKIPQPVLDALAAQGLSLDDVTVSETLEEKTAAVVEAIKRAPMTPKIGTAINAAVEVINAIEAVKDVP